MKRQIKVASTILLSMIFGGCDSVTINSNSDTTTSEPTQAQTKQDQVNDTTIQAGTQDSSKNEQTTQKDNNDIMIHEGKLIDSPVKGVNYECGQVKGMTDDNGNFKCISLPVRFKIGSAFIGEVEKVPENGIVTLQDLAGVSQENVEDEKVKKLAVFIQSLDDDGNISKNININQELVRKLGETLEDIQKLSFEEMQDMLKKAGVKRVVDQESAIRHILEYQNRAGQTKDKQNIEKTENFNHKNPGSVEQNSKEKNKNQKSPKNLDKTKQTHQTKEPVEVEPTDSNKKGTKDSALDTKKPSKTTDTKKPTSSKKDPVNKNNTKSVNSQKSSNDSKTAKVDPQRPSNGDLNKSTNQNLNSSSMTTNSSKKYLRIDDSMYINEKKDVLIYIDPELNKQEKLIYKNDKIRKITNKIYKNFSDSYDFIFLVTNNKERPKEVTYAGVFSKIKNDVRGIGVDIYDHTSAYGSDGKLKGVMHFAYRGAVLKGPTLHEISHYWANKFRNFEAKEDGTDGYFLGKSGHWGYTGFFGGKGQLGGFDATKDDFRFENEEFARSEANWKLYSAKDFSWNANGGNRIPYNDVELYLMGMISKSEVKDLLVPIPWGSPLSPEEKDYVVENKIEQRGRRYFVAVDVVRKSWSDILSEHNVQDREPSYQNSQKSFKVLTVLLDTKMPQTQEVDIISSQIEILAFKGDDHNDNNYNFWEATRGKGSLVVDGIEGDLEVDSEEIEVGSEFVSEEISFRGKIYKTIRSPYTGRVWLDRNIGANRVCEDFTDEECYGYYFQFGRGFDGHQLKNSPITSKKKSSLSENDDKFVLVGNGPRYDWLEEGVDDDLSARLAFMKDSSGNGICPAGFRVPTVDELRDETVDNEMGDAFPNQSVSDNFLRLPKNGYRNASSSDGKITEKDERGAYWSITTFDLQDSKRVRHLLFDDEGTITYGTRYFANADAIRCIKVQE
jgi:hypothetical protein